MNDFERLYEEFGPMVLRRCRFLLKDEDKALDAMQDVFIRIIERKEKLKNVCSSLFFTTATNVCLNKIRADKYRSGPQYDLLAETIEDTASSLDNEKIESSAILDCIFEDGLSKDRDIAVLHYVEGYTLEETAKKMKMSVSGIRKRLRGIKERAEKLGGQGNDGNNR